MRMRFMGLVLFVALVAVGLPLVAPGGASSAGRIAIGRVHEGFQPMRGKIFVLIIGNDARYGNPDHSRADAVHVAGINTRTMRGGILNFPRDSYVNIPGHGSGRINEALYQGGPDLLARTVESITGIRLDYWVMVGFQGFRGVIDEVGPITVRVPFDIQDPHGSGANLRKGKRNLNKYASLAWVRTRHNFSNGDIARSTNQGRFLIDMLKELRLDMDRSPTALLQWMSAARKYARFNIRPQELYRLAVLTASMKPGKVGMETVPVSVGSVGAASVVFIQGGAHSIYARFKKHGSL